MVSSYSETRHDFNCVCFSGSLDVLFCENRRTRGSKIQQLDCSKSPLTRKTGTKQIKTDSVVNELCCTQHSDEHLLVTGEENGMLCVYYIKTAELMWRMNCFLPNTIPAVTVDGASNILVCNNRYKEIYKVSTTGEKLGTILKNREWLFELTKMRWCRRSSSLTFVYKDFTEQWCVIAYRM